MARKHFRQVIGSAVILSVLIINSVFGVSATTNEASTNGASGNWDGTAAETYAGGTGTESDPYRITNANELVLMVQNNATNGSYFSIENDIAINDTSDPTWYENTDLKNWYSTEFDSSKAFWGTIFGNGHTISGLYYKDTETKEQCVGLIPIAWNTDIYDLTVDDAYLETVGSGVSAFIGFDNWAAINIYRCSAGKNVIIKSNSSDKLIAGGFIGTVPTDGNGLKIYDSISAVQFDTIDLSRCGGFIGDCWGSNNEWGKIEIQRSVSAVENVPTVQNYWSWSDFTNTYETVKGDGYNKVTVLTLEQMQGEAAKENMPGLLWDYMWFAQENDYPMVKRVCHETAGDINNDSSVDILDLIKAKKHIAGVAELTGADYNTADLDRNSEVNSADLIRLRKILLEC